MVPQNLAQAHESAATQKVSVAIINGFKPVHVEQHEAERAVSPPRRVEFGFNHSDEPAVVGQTCERVTHRESANLIEQARLINQRAAEHDRVAGYLAELRQEKRPVEELSGKQSGEVASHVEQSNKKQRIVVQRRVAIRFLVGAESPVEEDRGQREKPAGKKFPRTRKQSGGFGEWGGGGGGERRE